jgi:hypothetical protein
MSFWQHTEIGVNSFMSVLIYLHLHEHGGEDGPNKL